MVEALLIELDALLEAGRARPGAAEALAALRGLELPAGTPLPVGLLGGDVPLAAAAEQLRAAGFPAAAGNTLTTAAEAGAPLPDRRLLQAALRRLGLRTPLDRCALVLAAAPHRAACASLGVTALALGLDFSDWRDLPVLLAPRVDAGNRRNLAAALAVRLGPELEDVVVARAAPGLVQAHAMRWLPLPAAGPEVPRGLLTKVPVEVTVRLDPAGRPAEVQTSTPEPEALAEAAASVAGLFARGEVTAGARPPAPGATHVVETDPQGRPRLRRARFSS